MRAGKKIVAEWDMNVNNPQGLLKWLHTHSDRIREALLAYTPPLSPLRMILDRVWAQYHGGPLMGFTEDEIEAARAELDRLEGK